MGEKVRVAFRVDKRLKTEAEKVFKQMGMSASGAMNVFLAQCVREQRLPFQPGATEAEMEEKQFNALLDEVDEVLDDEGEKRDFGLFEELNLSDIGLEEEA